jgi:Flp pilus assembly protein TadG
MDTTLLSRCPNPTRIWPRLPPCRRFAASEGGATAVEFALIALPFFGLILVTLQIALVLWATQILETAVANASRQLYTGEFQNSASNAGKTPAELQGAFKTLVCSNVVGVFDCPAMVSVDVRTFTGFSDTTAAQPVTNGVYDTSGYGYKAPGRNDIVVVRASMAFPNYASIFSPGTTLTNGNQLIMATAAFRAEPF